MKEEMYYAQQNEKNSKKMLDDMKTMFETQMQ